MAPAGAAPTAAKQYASIDDVKVNEAFERGGIAVEPTDTGSRLAVPKKRADYDRAVFRLMLDFRAEQEANAELIREMYEVKAGDTGPGNAKPKGTSAKEAKRRGLHGTFDLRETGFREIWSQGNLDQRIPKFACPSTYPFGYFDDLEPEQAEPEVELTDEEREAIAQDAAAHSDFGTNEPTDAEPHEGEENPQTDWLG